MDCDAVFLFRGDIRYDTRIANFVSMYMQHGKRVVVVQGARKDEEFDSNGAHVIAFANRETGALGFLLYWFRAAVILGTCTARVYWASDLYSLPLAIWRARTSGGTAAYDSREMYAHIGALRRSNIRQKFWFGLEKFLLRYKPVVVTSGPMDSEYLVDRYGIPFPHVVRNVPRYRRIERTDGIRRDFGIGTNVPVMLYIGGIQEGRGIPTMVQLATLMPECAFVFIGNGVLENAVNQAAAAHPNIYYHPAIPNDEVIPYAASATLGFSLIEPITLSYYLALPNKLFEYIMAGTPVIASYVPQIEKIIKDYGVGAAVPWDNCDAAIDSIRQLLDNSDLYHNRADNCRRAAHELCWEKENASFAAFAQEHGIL